MSQEKDIAVVIGMNVNGLAVARTLGRHGVPVIGVDAAPGSPECRSRYLSCLWEHSDRQDSLADFLLQRAGQFSRPPVLLPVTDAGVRVVASRYAELATCYRIGMSSPELTMELLDKRGFANTAQRLGAPVPATVFVDCAADMAVAAGQLPYPCILKPQVKNPAYSQAGGKKAYLFSTREELVATYESFCHAEPRVVLQEYIPGTDGEVYFCLQYYDRRHRPLASFSGRKIRQWPPHCGGTATCEMVANRPELERLSTNFFQQVGFHGLCSMEFKRDPRDNSFKMIEPTVCRTDWQSAVADANGVPIPYIAYCDLTGRQVPSLPRRPLLPVKWTHLRSDRQSAAYYRRLGQLSLIGWLRTLLPPIRGAYWAVDDPVPWWNVVWASIKGKLSRLKKVFTGRKGDK